MPDALTPPAPGQTDGPRTAHPPGVVQGVLVDIIDLGDRVDDYNSTHNIPKPDRLARQCVLLYQSSKINPDTSRPFELAYECALSWNDKANLRKWLGNQRGQPITDKEALTPPNLATLIGANALLTVINKESAKGRTYARLTNVAPLMDGMTPIHPSVGYQRAAFWADRKEENRKEAALFTQRTAAAPKAATGTLADVPAALIPDDDDDSSLPF